MLTVGYLIVARLQKVAALWSLEVFKVGTLLRAMGITLEHHLYNRHNNTVRHSQCTEAKPK